MKKKYSKSVVMFILLTLLFSVTLSADIIQVKKCVNSTGSWCWAGAMECVVKFYDNSQSSKSQKQIVSHITTNPNTVPSTQKILKGLKESLQPVSVTVTEFTARPTEQELKAETDSNNIIYILYTWKQQGGYHAAVYNGYIGDTYYLMDPWGNPAPYAKRSYKSLMETNQLRWQRCYKFKRPAPTSISGKKSNFINGQSDFKIIYNTQSSDNTIDILFNVLSGNEKMIKIFNMSGSCLYEKNVQKNVLNAQVNLSNSTFASGSYLISIDNIDNSSSTSFKSKNSKKQAFYIVK